MNKREKDIVEAAERCVSLQRQADKLAAKIEALPTAHKLAAVTAELNEAKNRIRDLVPSPPLAVDCADGHKVLVQSPARRWDAEQLKKALPAKVWQAIERPAVVPGRIETAMSMSRVPLDYEKIEAECSTLNKPVVRVTIAAS